MSFRTTYILFGLLGALVFVFGLALWLAPITKVDSKYVLPSAHADTTKIEDKNIVKVELTRPEADVDFVFVRDKDKEFKLEKPAGHRISSSLVLSLINQVLDAKTETGDLTDNLKTWGLDKPRGEITLTTDNDTKLRVYLGELRNNRLYVTSSDKPKTVMVLDKTKFDAAFSQLADFRSRELIAVKNDDIHSIKIERPAKQKTERIVLHSADGKWRYEEPKYGAANLDGATEADAKGPSGVNSILSALTGLRAEGKSDDLPLKDKKDKKEPPKDRVKEMGFWQNDAKDEDLKKYGLDSDANASLVLEVKKDPTDKEGQKVLIGKETADKSGLYFARLWPERNVVTVTKKGLDVFFQMLDNPEAVRDRDLVKLSEKPDVIRIKYPDGKTIELVRSAEKMPPNPHGFPMAGGETWKLYRGEEKKSFNTDANAIKVLIDALVAKRQVKEFPANPDDPALGVKDPKDPTVPLPHNLTVSLWVDGIKKDEKKDPKKEDERPELKSKTPDVELSFGRPDSKYVAVMRRTGKDLKQVDVVKVANNVLEIARADQLAYLDKTLTPFFPAAQGPRAVVKLTLDIDGKTTVVERKKPDDPTSDWVLKTPPELDGRKADGGVIENKIIYGLNHLDILRWEELAPKPEQLVTMGLRNPTAKITLGLRIDKKDSEVSLLIGGPTDDKNGFYAKKSDRDEVFAIKKSALDPLKEPLLDLQVLDFASVSVKSIKLTGWLRRGKPEVVELVREGATAWKAKDLPPTVKVNSLEVERLLEAMVILRAKKFVVFKTGKLEAHGLDPAKGGLDIELTLEDKDKKTDKVTLTVGNPDGDGFFAVSNKHPGDVFTILKGQGDIFEKVKKDSEFLVK